MKGLDWSSIARPRTRPFQNFVLTPYGCVPNPVAFAQTPPATNSEEIGVLCGFVLS